jgi:bloom syndrome protein
MPNLTLLVTPEKLCSSEFMKLLGPLYQRGELNRLVVDEVGPVQARLPASH